MREREREGKQESEKQNVFFQGARERVANREKNYVGQKERGGTEKQRERERERFSPDKQTRR